MRYCFFSLSVALSLLFFTSCDQNRLAQSNSKCLRLNFDTFPLTLDPRKAADVKSSILLFNLYEGLMRVSPTGKLEPALAESVEVSEDGLTYTFFLRDAKWSNGDPITAYNFERSFKMMLLPDFPSRSAHHLYPIQGAKKAKRGKLPPEHVGISCKDEKTLVITLERQAPYFLETTSFCTLFPAHPDIAEDSLNQGSALITSGPFILDHCSIDKEIVLRKNPLYWDFNSVHLDKVHFSIIKNELTALSLFEQGELDVIGSPFSLIPRDALDSLVEKDLIHSHKIGAVTVVEFNTTHPILKNKNFRKAISAAINRKEMVKHINKLNDEPACGLVPPVLKGGRRDELLEDNNPETANRYLQIALKELGIEKKAIPPIPFMCHNSELALRIVQVICDQVERTLGIKLQLSLIEAKSFYENLGQTNFAITHSAWVVQYNDPVSILERFTKSSNFSNHPRWESALFRKVLKESNYAKSSGERQRILLEAEKIFMDDMPQAPLFYWGLSYMISPRVKNLYFSPIGSVHLREVDIIKDKEAL